MSSSTTSTTRTIAVGAIGNVHEWYDFAIYGYFAAGIGRAFFPGADPVARYWRPSVSLPSASSCARWAVR